MFVCTFVNDSIPSSSSLSMTDSATQEYRSKDEKNTDAIPPPTDHDVFSSLPYFLASLTLPSHLP